MGDVEAVKAEANALYADSKFFPSSPPLSAVRFPPFRPAFHKKIARLRSVQPLAFSPPLLPDGLISPFMPLSIIDRAPMQI
eukprot:3666362-Rhodomonas_salina.2